MRERGAAFRGTRTRSTPLQSLADDRPVVLLTKDDEAHFQVQGERAEKVGSFVEGALAWIGLGDRQAGVGEGPTGFIEQGRGHPGASVVFGDDEADDPMAPQNGRTTVALLSAARMRSSWVGEEEREVFLGMQASAEAARPGGGPVG